MKKIVLDCSIIIKWYFSKGEKNIKEARNLQDKIVKCKTVLFLPPLFFIEFINVSLISKKASLSLIKKSISELLALKTIFSKNNQNYFNSIAYFVNKFGITAYDAAYMALAKEKNAVFITADEKLVKKAGLDFVKSLKESYD
jgi:predicted nucleic acid-binding protein